MIGFVVPLWERTYTETFKEPLPKAWYHAEIAERQMPKTREQAVESWNPASRRYYELLDAATAAGLRMSRS